jgi:hypothetical protein
MAPIYADGAARRAETDMAMAAPGLPPCLHERESQKRNLNAYVERRELAAPPVGIREHPLLIRANPR